MAEDVQYHNSSFLVRLAKYLGLDPKQITTMSVTSDSADVVEIRWEGLSMMSAEEFELILKDLM